MTGLTIGEIYLLLLLFYLAAFLFMVAFGIRTEGKRKDSPLHRLEQEEAEKKAVDKILQDYLDEMEDNMFYRDGEYRSGNSSTPQVGDGCEIRTIKINEMTVDFSAALVALKNGKRIRRATWNVSMRLYEDEQIHVVRENGDFTEVVAAIGIFDLPFRLEDVLAEDWQILD